jgi:hypothetical protein
VACSCEEYFSIFNNGNVYLTSAARAHVAPRELLTLHSDGILTYLKTTALSTLVPPTAIAYQRHAAQDYCGALIPLTIDSGRRSTTPTNSLQRQRENQPCGHILRSGVACIKIPSCEPLRRIL